jgi:dihydrofolate synthase/folylpolyglutamate synthase
MHFDDAVQYLFGLGHEVLTMKLGLRNTELLFESLDHPEKAFPAVQIAGTNGKGSVAAVLDSICRQAGIKTGCYTSPHLVSITERIRIDGQEVSPELFASHATVVKSKAAKLVVSKTLEASPTFFEQVTAIAMSAFRDGRVDLAILETGLGGRLDSTTAARARLLAITPIALDHQQYLGDTLAEIAAEKAAIIRRGTEVIIGSQPPEALSVILEKCEQEGVTATYDTCRSKVEDVTNDGRFCVTFQTPFDSYDSLWLGLRGKHQIENVAVAIQLAEKLRAIGFTISRKAIIEGVARAQHPGRLELINEAPPVLFDGAHNVEGAGALRDYLELFALHPMTIVFGCMQDKQVEEILGTLCDVADYLVLTPIDNPRAMPVEELHAIARDRFSEEQIAVATSSSDAMKIARARKASGLICVTGSLYLIGEVRSALAL